MGQTPGWHRDKPGARRRLLVEVAAYAAATRARVTVVFDGAPEEGLPDGSVFRGVRVYFPPPGGDADSIIERLVTSSSDPRGLTVVTSDRQLALDCRSAGARTVRSGEFRKAMAAVAATREAPDPGAAEDAAADSLDDWLRYFGIGADDER